MAMQTIVERHYLQDIEGMPLVKVIELLQQINTKCQYPEGQKATFELSRRVDPENQAPYIRVERLETREECIARLRIQSGRRYDIKERQAKVDVHVLQQVIEDDFNE